MILEANHFAQLNAVKNTIGRQRGNRTINSALYPKAHGSDIKTLVNGWSSAAQGLTPLNKSERAQLARWQAFVKDASLSITLADAYELPPPLLRRAWDELFALAGLLRKRKAPVPAWGFARQPSLFEAPADTWFTQRLGLVAAFAVGAAGLGYLFLKKPK